MALTLLLLTRHFANVNVETLHMRTLFSLHNFGLGGGTVSNLMNFVWIKVVKWKFKTTLICVQWVNKQPIVSGCSVEVICTNLFNPFSVACKSKFKSATLIKIPTKLEVFSSFVFFYCPAQASPFYTGCNVNLRQAGTGWCA